MSVYGFSDNKCRVPVTKQQEFERYEKQMQKKLEILGFYEQNSDFTFHIDSDTKLEQWINNIPGNNYEKVYVHSGTYNFTVTSAVTEYKVMPSVVGTSPNAVKQKERTLISLTDSLTKYVYAEEGSKINIYTDTVNTSIVETGLEFCLNILTGEKRDGSDCEIDGLNMTVYYPNASYFNSDSSSGNNHGYIRLCKSIKTLKNCNFEIKRHPSATGDITNKHLCDGSYPTPIYVFTSQVSNILNCKFKQSDTNIKYYANSNTSLYQFEVCGIESNKNNVYNTGSCLNITTTGRDTKVHEVLPFASAIDISPYNGGPTGNYVIEVDPDDLNEDELYS